MSQPRWLRLLRWLRGSFGRLDTGRLMITCTIVHTNNYDTLRKQCLGNTINWSPTAEGCILRREKGQRQTGTNNHEKHPSADYKVYDRIFTWQRLARIHYIFTTFLYVADIAKYRLVELISEGSPLHELEFIDCWIMGRFRFFGRTNKVSGKIASVYLAAFLAYRWSIHLFGPTFKFYAAEFLLNTHDEVLENELRVGPSGKLKPIETDSKNSSPTILGLDPAVGKISRKADEANAWRYRSGSVRSRTFVSPPAGQPEGVNSIFFLKSPFNLREQKWILRPNRTSENWLILNTFTQLNFVLTVSVIFVWMGLMYWALVGSIMTNLGFEMSYPTCVAWLRKKQREEAALGLNGTFFTSAYRAPEVLAFEIPIDDIPARIPLDGFQINAFNWYDTTRIIVDIIENHFVYVEFLVSFMAQFYLLSVHSLDVILNARGIRSHLESLLKKMEARRELDNQRQDLAKCYERLMEAHPPLVKREFSPADFGGLSETKFKFPPIVNEPATGEKASEPMGVDTADQQTWTLAQHAQHFHNYGHLSALPPRQGQGHLMLFPKSDRPEGEDVHEEQNDVEDEEDDEEVDEKEGEEEEEKNKKERDEGLNSQLSEEIADLQAIMADHFDTITRGFNLYISFFVIILLLIWLGYTVVICSWMGTVRSRAVEWEFLLAETGGTVFALTLLAGAAWVRSHNVKLYPLVTRVMALDCDRSITKIRWITILKYYYPKPLYCFTIFGSSQISWLLCLKLISWILSAFIVLANFFYRF